MANYHPMSRWLDGVSWALVALLFVPLGGLVYIFGGWLLIALGAPLPWHIGDSCITKTSGKAENVGGFDFEFEEVNCDAIGSPEVRMIFVSRHGQHQRYRLTAYRDAARTPAATLVAPQTVRLSLGSVASFDSRDDHWRDLRVIYDYSAPKLYNAKQP